MVVAFDLLDQLGEERSLSIEGYRALLDSFSPELGARAASLARALTDRHFGRGIYVRGLIEFSNICRQDCYYCGLRRSKPISRYRLTADEVLEACAQGYALGYKTFVLQSGEDPFYTDQAITKLVSLIRSHYPDVAITLSVGERSPEAYRAWFEAGADRYLLRHETADATHYGQLHPETMQLSARLACLESLRTIGYQVGAGFMVGSPGQTTAHLAQDLYFIQGFDPAMVGIGPFMPSSGTPLGSYQAGSLELTLFLISLLRIQGPTRLIPATTSLASLDPLGRALAFDAGANVVMPNLSPVSHRKDYALYDGKLCIADAAQDAKQQLSNYLHDRGYELLSTRGDYRAIDSALPMR